MKEEKVVVIGAGQMGSQIAALSAMAGIDTNLFDILKEAKGEMSNHLQTEIVRIIMTLDRIKVFHADPNPLNFMVGKNDKLYIIDYGFGKKIDDKLVKKYETNEINAI